MKNTVDTLQNLLAANQNDEQTQGKVASSRLIHLPMTLSALYFMGADSARLQQHFDLIYSDKASTPISVDNHQQITQDNWQEQLGVYDNFRSFLNYFSQALDEHDIAPVLKESLPVLLQGASAHAFHPLLRLGYALELGNRKEIIFALAYWAATFYSYPPIDDQQSSQSPSSFLQKLQATPSFRTIKFAGNIDARIKLVLLDSGFSTCLAPIDLPKDNEIAMTANLLIKLFLRTKDFTVLHGVTSCYALRLIQPYISDKITDVLTSYWYAIGAAYVTVGAPSYGHDINEQQEIFSWDKIISMAINSQDDHIIKFVYTCFREKDVYDPELYQLAATEQVKSPATFCAEPKFE